MSSRLPTKTYDRELRRLQQELVEMQYWVRESGARVVAVFEGRDAAGKGGAIRRVMEYLNPRFARVVALGVPTERERSQWYFQRYVEHLPAAGEMVLFDRSWYNRAGVEKVMGYCTPDEHQRFLRQCPIFERLLLDEGILLTKYWFSVSDEEQERRFAARLEDPLRRWKISPMDLEARVRWVDYSRAKDEMMVHTDTRESPWFTVEGDDKRAARLNCIAHLLTRVPYDDDREPDLPDLPELPRRGSDGGYVRPERETQHYVPDHSATLEKAEKAEKPGKPEK